MFALLLGTMMEQGCFEELFEKDITQCNLYRIAGKTDDVCTFNLRENSESFLEYGDSVTVELVYTQDERRKLEQDDTALDQKTKVTVRDIVQSDRCKSLKLNNDGLPLRDIIHATVLHYTPPNNTFTSKEKRSLDVLSIPYKSSGGLHEIDWWYGFLCKRKEDGDQLMPEWEADFLACKSLSTDQLTNEEKVLIKRPRVMIHTLQWKQELGIITKDEYNQLSNLRRDMISERLDILKKELSRVGVSYSKFLKDYKKQALFIFERLIRFHDLSLNSTGRYPIYMDFKSFLHIYLRHVDEVNMGEQLAQKDKFQLYEKDIILIIKHIMHQLDDEYQSFREKNPLSVFRKTGKNAIYCKGDYYELYVDKNGRLETFYKASRSGKVCEADVC